MDALHKRFPGLSGPDHAWLRRELLRRAATDYEQTQLWGEAAACWAELGAAARAGELYRRGGDLGRAAAALLDAGHCDEALALYQAWEARLAPGDVLNRVQALLGQAACHLLAVPPRRQAGRGAYLQARERLAAEAEHGLLGALCWAALGRYGVRLGRYDLVQEGFEHALARCQETSGWPERLVIGREYLAAVRGRGDRLLARRLEERLAEWETVEAVPDAPPTEPVGLVHTFGDLSGLVLNVFTDPSRQWALARSYMSGIWMWDLTRRELVHHFPHQSEIWEMATASDFRTFLIACQDQKVRWWDPLRRELLHAFEHSFPVAAVAYAPDERSFLAGGWARDVVWWDLQRREERGRFRHETTIYSLAFSPDGRSFLYGGSNGPIVHMDLQSSQVVRRFEQDGPIGRLVFLPGGKQFLSASRNKSMGGSTNHAVTLWDLDSGVPLHRFEHEDQVWDVDLSSDGRRMLTGSADQTVRLWDLYRRTELHRFTHGDAVYCTALSRDGHYALSGGGSQVKLWRLPG